VYYIPNVNKQQGYNMIKLMLTQRNGATAQRMVGVDTDFDDFHNLVTYENFGKANEANEANGTVYVPHSDTTYTLLTVNGVTEIS